MVAPAQWTAHPRPSTGRTSDCGRCCTLPDSASEGESRAGDKPSAASASRPEVMRPSAQQTADVLSGDGAGEEVAIVKQAGEQLGLTLGQGAHLLLDRAMG